MNDLIFLTIEPIENGHELAWERLQPLINGFQETLIALSRNIHILDLEISDVALILVGSPVIGSLRFQFKLDVKAEFKPKNSKRERAQATEGQMDLKRLTQDVGVNALGGVIAASIMLAFAGQAEEPAYGPEARLAELCAAYMSSGDRASLDEMKVVAEHAGCRSVRLQYQSYPPLELAGVIPPISIKREITTPPPERLELYLRTHKPVVVYLNGEQRVGYFVTRLDNHTEAIAIFKEPIHKFHLNDRLLTEARRLTPADRQRLFISPLSLGRAAGVGIEARLENVRSVIEITANHGAMGNRLRDPNGSI